MKTMTVGAIAELLDGEVIGDPNAVVADGRPFEEAASGHLTFAESARHVHRLSACNAGCVIVSRKTDRSVIAAGKPSAYVLVDEPLTAFLTVLAEMRPPRPRAAASISSSASISASAVIGDGTNIGPGAVIGDEVHIGENCHIAAGVVIGAGCRLGNDVILHPYVVLYDDVDIADRVVIHASSVIGADGFGYRLQNGRPRRLPHLGTVRIEEDVEIGVCATVDRALIGATVIGAGTKIDNMVLIAHNCELGKNNLIVGQVGFAGSVTTGDNVVCAGQVGIADHVHLGTGSVIASQSGVHKDVREGQTFLGTPAMPVADQRRVYMAQRKLPEALRTLRALSAQVAEIRQQLGLTEESAEAPRNEAA